MLDVFRSNAFSLANMTAAIETAPYAPQLLGSLGLFEEEPIYTTVAIIEKMQGKRALLRVANRGTVMDVRSTAPRTAIALNVPHVPYHQSVLADDVQNMRAFGKETELETLANHVNKQLTEMKKDHEATHEFHRVSALKGILYDADNTTVIFNYFTEFAVSQLTQNWLGTDATFATTTNGVIRQIANKLGAETFDGILALCGNTYFDAIINHASMKTAYERWRDGEFLRTAKMGPAWYGAAINGFMYQNILFVNYRGAIGNVTFIPDTEAYYVPRVPGLFKTVIAPANFAETVNTRGKLYYARQEPMKFNVGVELHTQSNALMVPARPDLIIKSTYAAS